MRFARLRKRPTAPGLEPQGHISPPSPRVGIAEALEDPRNQTGARDVVTTSLESPACSAGLAEVIL